MSQSRNRKEAAGTVQERRCLDPQGQREVLEGFRCLDLRVKPTFERGGELFGSGLIRPAAQPVPLLRPPASPFPRRLRQALGPPFRAQHQPGLSRERTWCQSLHLLVASIPLLKEWCFRTTQVYYLTALSSEVSHGLTGLKSRCQQGCAPLWRLRGRMFPCFFQLL